eukprot:TRINITY_DN23747_c0_g1_i1.p1 TRINITY_DN23747_c0_g1~~TRINITY_DN23747_c0_g1_i1.p1  ORF type:complete len:307 (+),score=80.30 TRINITY_DN23747_c0_g1_i1:80-922(+)
MSGVLQLYVRCTGRSDMVAVELPHSATVEDVLAALAAQGVESSGQLHFQGRPLLKEEALSDAGLSAESVLELSSGARPIGWGKCNPGMVIEGPLCRKATDDEQSAGHPSIEGPQGNAIGDVPMTAGKHMWSLLVHCAQPGSKNYAIGVAGEDVGLGRYLDNDPAAWVVLDHGQYYEGGSDTAPARYKSVDGERIVWKGGDTVTVLLDCDASRMSLFVNGRAIQGDPVDVSARGDGPLFPVFGSLSGAGAAQFTQTPASGAWEQAASGAQIYNPREPEALP